LVPKLPKSGYIFWMLYPMSIFGSIHLHLGQNYPNPEYIYILLYIVIYIHILDITSRIYIHSMDITSRIYIQIFWNLTVLGHFLASEQSVRCIVQLPAWDLVCVYMCTRARSWTHVTPRASRPDKMKPPPGHICQFHPPGFIMTSRVRSN
jgi:hypothetical protein